MEQNNLSYLATEKVSKLMGKYAVPCIVSLLVGALYNIVDQIFIANADYLGSYGNAILLCVIRVNEETFAYAKEYFFWIALGIPFYMFGQAMNPVIRSDGSPKFAMFATLAGAITNIILDPIFIFPMKMGMAAVQNMCTKYGAMDEIFGQPEYAQIPLAVLGIVMKFFQIAISIAIGFAAGCIPVVGYNIGANRRDRAKQLFTYLLIAEAAVGIVALLIVEFLPHQLIGIFGASNESAYYTGFAVKSFRIYLCMMPLAMINKGTFIYLQALGKAVLSTIISLTREIIFGVFLPIIMPIYMGLDGLLWSFPVADLLTFVIATFIVRNVYKELALKGIPLRL